MKNLSKISPLLILFILTYFATNAQDQKSLFESWGNIEISLVKGGSLSSKYEISLKDWDLPYLWHVSLKSTWSDSGETSEYPFYSKPNHQAHPPCLTAGADWGDDEMKYFRKFGEERLLIIGDFLYSIMMKDDSDYVQVKSIYTKKIKKIQIKKMIEVAKKADKMDHEAIIKEYLKKEKAALAAKAPAYKANHSEYYALINKETGWSEDDIEFSRQEQIRQHITNVARVKNNTSRVIWIGMKTGHSKKRLSPGDNIRVDCNVADYYILDPSTKSPLQHLLKPRNWCGKTYSIN